jgi:hypothetical protein
VNNTCPASRRIATLAVLMLAGAVIGAVVGVAVAEAVWRIGWGRR